MLKFVFAAALLCLPLSAQYPGQYPSGQYPPGQYPPGQYPPGQGPGVPGGGISIPRRGHKKTQKGAENAQPTISADGHVLSSDDRKLVIATDDGRTLTMTVTPATTYSRSGGEIDRSKVIPQSLVHVEATEDDEAFLTVVKVEYLKDPSSETAAAPSTATSPSDAPTSTSDASAASPPLDLSHPPDDPDRPILRRGKPRNTDTSSDDAPATPKTAAASPKRKDDSIDFTIGGKSAPVQTAKSKTDDLLARSKEWAMTFTQGLPNYVCQQLTTRYMEQSRSSGWSPLDVVTAKVIYEDGHESYKEITVGGRKTNKSMMELGGSTSTGEFASVLQSLFEGNRAQFKFSETTSVSKSPAGIYSFKVPLHNSDWTIIVGGQALRPVYSGSVWIDKATAQVRRIEMGADNIPKDFPDDTVESAVDYDEVHLGTATFLLPVHAENLACQRGTTICTKNTIDFRDYHKYSGESTVVFK
jgi:hypothetical protein